MHRLCEIKPFFNDGNFNEVETAILGKESFNLDQTNFINFFKTAVIEAGPGSGKTTVLSAKIALLFKKLESNGSLDGVCVITHTNAAVGEILKNLSKLGYEKIPHPHFIGTINEFFNRYGMNPYLQQKFKNTQKWNLIEEDALSKLLKIDLSSKPEHNWMTFEDRRETALNLCKKLMRSHLYFNSEKELEAQTFESGAFENYRENYLFFKQKYWEDGIFHMNDTFCLSQLYFHFPHVMDRIRKRFKYIFMDEYQDIAPLAFKLFKKLFKNPHNILQIIGDKNQHISYSNPEVNTQEFDTYYLNQINRFGDTIIKPLNAMFALNKLSALDNEKSLKPLIYIYNNAKDIPNYFYNTLQGQNLFKDSSQHYILVFVRNHINDLSINLLKTPKNSQESKFQKSKNLIYGRLATIMAMRVNSLKKDIQKSHPNLDIDINKALFDFLKKDSKLNIHLRTAINALLSAYNIHEVLTEEDKLFKDLSSYKSNSLNSERNILQPINAKTVHDLKGQTLTSSLVYLKKDSIEEKAFLDSYTHTAKLEETELINKRVLYVAMSRATTQLVITLHQDSYEKLTTLEINNIKAHFEIIHIKNMSRFT